jgi:chorismate--pyruvate lyase
MRFEPDWRPHLSLLRPAAPSWLRAWLSCPDSLTRALSRSCGGTFRVRLIGQGWGRPRPDEQRCLDLPHTARAIVRQVFLSCAEAPRVYARTIIPRRSLHGAPGRLMRLGDTPLGEVLFSARSLQRERAEVAHLTPIHTLFHLATAAPGGSPLPAGLWARRSVYRLEGLPLLVTEVFLPSLTGPRRCSGRLIGGRLGRAPGR